MKIYLGNLLGRLSNAYRFSDGSIIRASGKESLVYLHNGLTVPILFFYDPSNGFEYEIHKSVQGAERLALIEKLKLYCKIKGLQPVVDGD